MLVMRCFSVALVALFVRRHRMPVAPPKASAPINLDKCHHMQSQAHKRTGRDQ